MSPRAVLSQDHLYWLGHREGKNPAGALRQIGLVWKPTTISNWITATATSSAAEWFAQLAPFNRDTSPFRFPSKRGCFAPLCDYPVWTESTLLTLSSRIAIRVPGCPAIKLLSLHELPRVTRCMPLTKPVSTRYAGVQTGGSRCCDSAAKESGSVPGTLDNQGKEARS